MLPRLTRLGPVLRPIETPRTRPTNPFTPFPQEAIAQSIPSALRAASGHVSGLRKEQITTL